MIDRAATGSERVAQSLLAAWDSGDLPRLRVELGQIALSDSTSLPAIEVERLEIVQGIAQTMQVWLKGAKRKHADLNIALSLLRHLATQQEIAA